jgi:hypothetical protein
MTSYRDYPEQLPGEPDSAYAHLRAWVDFDARGRAGDTAAFAEAQDIRADYVRRLRSLYNWSERAREVETFDALTGRLAAEKAAEAAAEDIAALKVANAAQYVELERRVLAKAHEAIERLDVAELTPAMLPRFVLGALKASEPRGAAAVPEPERIPIPVGFADMEAHTAELIAEFQRRGLMPNAADE